MKAKKKYLVGKKVDDIRLLVRYAELKRPLFKKKLSGYELKPAAFYVNWSLSNLIRFEFYEAIPYEKVHCDQCDAIEETSEINYKMPIFLWWENKTFEYLLSISSQNYGEDGVGLTSEQITKLI